MVKKISLEINEKDLQKIKEGAKADSRSLSSFIRKASLDKTKELIEG